MSFYKTVVRPLLFRVDPERMHDMTVGLSKWAGKAALMRLVMLRAYAYRDPVLECEVARMHFANPVGLAAGWDKSGVAIAGAGCLGFGFYEIGSISADPSSGNPRPRIFRLPEDRALIVHYGLQNDGAETIAPRIARGPRPVPLGVNIVKTNRGIDAPPDTDDAIYDDYLRTTRLVKDHADYLVYNLSCPNTEMGRDFFAEPGGIRGLLERLQSEELRCPVFLKVSPLGGSKALDRMLKEVDGHAFVSGFMLNLPPGKQVPLETPAHQWRDLPGAISGKPVEGLINEQLSELYRLMDKKRYHIIAAGGIFSAEDAYRKIRLGASAVQLLTALVYEGPGIVARINRGLCRLLQRDGFASIADAVGEDHATS